MSMSATPQQVPKLQLHGVYGLSAPNRAVAAACPTADNLVATAAGSFVVISDASADQQVQLLRSTTSNQTLQCLAWSCCGTHVAAGEAGNNPAVVVWNASSGACVRELKGHKHTVNRLCFSPDGKLLASVGGGADACLCLWDWHTGSVLCKQKVAADTSSLVFTEDSSHILAAGKSGIKSWSLMWASPRATRSRSSSGGTGSSSNADAAAACGALSLTARQVNLKQQQQQRGGSSSTSSSMCFVDLCLAPCLPGQPVGSNGVYALTDKGSLLLLRSTGRTVDRSINLQVREAFGLAATQRLVACACSQGTVRLFSSKALGFKANLPYWSCAGTAGVDSSQFADARGCSFGPGSQSEGLLVVAYSSHEVILWDIHNLAQIHPVRSFASHTGCIWDVCPFRLPNPNPSSSSSRTVHEPEADVVLGCATCATDGFIRFWSSTDPASMLQPMASVQAGLPSDATTVSQPGNSSSGKVQLRCMRISHDDQLLAAGDTAGNVHIYNLATLQLVVVQEAHDLDVLCLDFSPPSVPAAAAATAGADAARGSASDSAGSGSSRSRNGKGLAVSGSRDTLIHVYDACDGFRLLETLDEHEAEVTAVRFTCGGKGLVSCGADHSIIFRVLGAHPGAAYGYKVALKETLPQHLLYDLVVDPLDAYVLTADQNGIMRQWDAASGRVLRTMQPEVGAGKVVRLCMDPGGSVAICCHSDGFLRLYDIKSGRLAWRAWGHASLVAAAAVTADSTQIVSVGGDGCVIVWSLPDDLVAQLRQAAAHVAAAKQQAGSPVALPRLLSRQQQEASGAPSCAPLVGASCVSTPSPAVGGPGSGAAASALTTPGSCASDGSVLSSTLKRLQEGKPLVSADKLPRWARTPTSGSATGNKGGSSGGRGGSGAGASQRVQQQQRRLSKWLSGRAASSGAAAAAGAQDGTSCEVAPSPEPVCDSTALGEAAAGSQQQQVQQQQQPASLPWHCDSSRVLVRHWSDGSSFNKEAAAVAAASASAAAAVDAEAAVAREASAGSQVLGTHAEEGHGQLGVDETAAAEQQPDAPDKSTQSTPAGPGAVVRDLFKSHFSSLQQAVRGPKAAHHHQDAIQAHQAQHQAAEEDDCLTVQQDRQSFSAKFKRGRGSLSQVSSPGPDSAATPTGRSPPDTATSALTGTTTAEQSTGLTPQGSKLFRAAAAAPAATSAPSATPPAATAVEVVEEGEAGQRPYSQEPSPREKRWRQGQMKPELAGMWERLESLQAQFVQQQAQATRASPARPKSSLGHASPVAQKRLLHQQQVARRRSETSAGQRVAAVEAAGGQQQQQQALLLQRQASPRGYAPVLSPKSSPRDLQGSLASRMQALAISRKNNTNNSNSNNNNSSNSNSASSRQPWVSPTTKGAGKAVKHHAIRCSPARSPPPSNARKTGGGVVARGESSGGGSNTPVFGSRTHARSLQRRRSSTTDEAAADANASDPAQAPPQLSSAAAGGAAAAASVQADSVDAVQPQQPTPTATPEVDAAAAPPSPAAAAVTASPAGGVAAQEQEDRSFLAGLLSDDDTNSQMSSPQPAIAAAAATSPSLATSTPEAARAARLAELLAWDSCSPEATPASAQAPASAAAASAASTPGDQQLSREASSQSVGKVQQLRLDDVLRQSSSSPRSPSMEPSESSSPDRHRLHSPLASASSPKLLHRQHHQHHHPQQQQATVSPIGTAAAAAARLQGGAAAATGGCGGGGRSRLLELDGQLDVSAEVRVSIGTSIAARSPARAATSTSPLANPGVTASGGQDIIVQAATTAAAAVTDTPATVAPASAAGARSSVDLTPVPANGLVCYAAAADTPIAGAAAAEAPVVATAGTATAAAAGTQVPQECAHQMLLADPVALPGKAGVTVTPAGNTEVWPGWGGEAAAAWEATPSPTAVTVPVKKLWGADVATAPAAAAASLAAEGSSCSAGDVAVLSAENTEALSAEASMASTAVGDAYGGPGLLPAAGESGSGYWVAQNPCYDMTPHGSAGRNSRGLTHDRGQDSAGNSAAAGAPRCSDTPSLHSHPVRELSSDAHITSEGSGSVVAAAAGGGGREGLSASEAGGASTPVAFLSAGGTTETNSVGGASRRTSFLSARDDSAASSPAASLGGGVPSCGGGDRDSQQHPHQQQQRPSTPGSTCGSSDPGSVTSSSTSKMAGTLRRLGSWGGAGSGGGGRFSGGGRGGGGGGVQSLLGGHSTPQLSLGPQASASGLSGGGGGGGRPSSASLGRQDSRPASPSSGVRGLLQRMKLMPSNRSSRRQSLGGSPSVSGGGGCMSAAVADDDGDDGDSGILVSSRQQQHQQVGVQPGSSNTAAQVAATVEHFKHSIFEMQQLLQGLQGLSLDANGTRELNRLLTPRKAKKAAAAQDADDTPPHHDSRDTHGALQQQQQQQQAAAAGSTCSSSHDSPAVQGVSLQQRLQQEVLCSISQLHAAITGLPLPAASQGAGVSGSSPGTPAWIASHDGSSSSSHNSQQQLRQQQQHDLANSPAAAGSSCKAPAAATAGPRAWAQELAAGLSEACGSSAGAAGQLKR